jgi:hypothetical protein
MNPYTVAKRLILVHSTGTGKTKKALLCALQYNRDVTIIGVHSIQLNPFLMELDVKKGSTVPNVYPSFNKRIDMLTCKSVLTAMRKGDTLRLDHYLKGRVIIIDEMHHIRNTSERCKPTALFDSIVNVIGRYKDSIVIALTATLLVDVAQEIHGVYKLMKARNAPHGNPEYVSSLLAGYVSMHNSKNLDYDDVIVKCYMTREGKQWEMFQKHKEDKSSVHSRTGAVSRFVTQDDEHASELNTPTRDIVGDMLKGRSFNDVREYYKECVSCLRHLSIKMYMLVKHLLKYPHYPKYVFDSWKKRGGINRLVDVLTMPAIGYRIVTSEQDAMDTTRGPKILVLHRFNNVRGSNSIANRLVDIFNSSENADGRLIQVMLATPKFSESMSLRTSRECHIMSVMWNKTSEEQVKGRSNRRSSLKFLPKEERHITNYFYVLYQPDGEETFESHIREAARVKYRAILPCLDVLRSSSIERLYRGTTGEAASQRDVATMQDAVRTYRQPVVNVNTRINGRMRMHSQLIGYRDVDVRIDTLLSYLEVHDDLFDMMGAIYNSESGYTRLVNVVVQCLEKLYADKQQGVALTTKQEKALTDTQKAFVMYEGYHTHILYFYNNDTVEYQRMAKEHKRVVRLLNTVTWKWEDLIDKKVAHIITQQYDRCITSFTQRIRSEWAKCGCYVTRYILSSCYRLVRYKYKEDIAKASAHGEADKRKVSRGEKWQYYSKGELVEMIRKMTSVPHVMAVSMLQELTVADLFAIILRLLSSKEMMLVLPV